MTHEKRAENILLEAATSCLSPEQYEAFMSLCKTDDTVFQRLGGRFLLLAGHKEGAAERGEWRKWPEEKPEKRGVYWVTMEDGRVTHTQFGHIGWDIPCGFENNYVVAFKPYDIPAPYTPEKGEGG